MIPSAALVAAMMHDKDLRACVGDAGLAPSAYIASTFDFRRVALHTGERMIVAIARTGCMVSRNSAVRVYREVGGGFRLVFSDNAMPETVEASADGTISSSAHDTIDTIVEPVYAWNGTSYVFAPQQSHVYDISVEQRRPYQVPVRFAPGTSSIVLRGTYAENFGETYVFQAKAGQTLTIELLNQRGHPPGVALNFGDQDVTDVNGNRWSGVLHSSGTYTLDVFGFDIPDHRTLLPYSIRLVIH